MTARLTFTALIVGTTLAAMPGSAMAGGRPQEMPPAAYRALVAEGQALNARYGNAVTRLSSEQFNGLYNAGGSKMAPEALNELVVTSEAMNRRAVAQFHGLPPAAYSALVAQGQALNARYGNAVTRLSSEQFNGLYNAGGSKLTPEALNALVVRGEALNKLSRQTTPMSPPPASPPTIASQSSFAWDDFGIGMAAAFGLILLTGGLAVAVRTGTRSRVGVPS